MITSRELIADPLAHYPAATVACFDPTIGELPRRELNAQRTVEFLERLGAAGAPAVLIAASTGQGHLRTVTELESWFVVASQAKLPNTMKMALLRPEDGLVANERLVALLSVLDYPVVFVRPGTNLPADASDEMIADNLRPIVVAASQRGMAVGVYSIPDVSGVKLSPAATARLVQGPGGGSIVAVKITEANYEQSTRLFLEQPALARLKIVQGWDPFLATALRDGPQFDAQQRQRCGVTSGPMSFAVHQYQHILSAAQAGDWDEVALAQQAVTQLFEAMQDDPTKFADLQRAKFVMGLGQPLSAEVSAAQIERLLHALESLPRAADQQRLARSLDLMGDGPFHERLQALAG